MSAVLETDMAQVQKIKREFKLRYNRVDFSNYQIKKVKYMTQYFCAEFLKDDSQTDLLLYIGTRNLHSSPGNRCKTSQLSV
jgi:hypothetical protein